jgi:RNA polymerase sigma factor (sigma-70 family)
VNQADRQTGPEPPDRDLVGTFLAGRTEEGFLALYRRHTALLYRFSVRCLSGSRASAEDAVQETWLRAVRALPQFEWRCALSTWLVGIAQRVCMEASRDSARLLTFDPAQEIDEPAAFAADAASLLDIERLLAALPPGYRAVLTLHDIEGFTHDEIAAALGIEPGTAKSQLFRARRAAREWLSATPRRAHGEPT